MSYYATYVKNHLVDENTFLTMPIEENTPPLLDNMRHLLPEPFWQHHDNVIACWWKVWELAFHNIRQPTPASGFVANYIDTAFNDHLFMWDSAFILMFARYGSRAFNFQRTLDNLYAKQHPDGFICREIRESDGTDLFQRFDPASTGPNILPWSEWEYYLNFADGERLGRVFPVLVAYHRWLRTYRTWQDGSYWTSGWGCGMDNQPRMPELYSPAWSHGHQSWIDACLQQLYSANLLLQMAKVLGRSDELKDFVVEYDHLATYVNRNMWDDSDGYYFDRRADGSLSNVKTIGAYWALIADIVPAKWLEQFIAHLQNPREFNRPHRVPSLSADHPKYQADGGYWLGGVWAPTNYMVLRGLTQVKQDQLAHEIACNHLERVVDIFEQTGTVWENYSPESNMPGNPAKADFVGWTGLPSTAVLLEYIFGLRPDCQANTLTWDVRLLEAHGVRRYPFGKDGLLDLHCDRRNSTMAKPVIHTSSSTALKLHIIWDGGTETQTIAPG